MMEDLRTAHAGARQVEGGARPDQAPSSLGPLDRFIPLGNRVMVLPGAASETFVEGGQIIAPDAIREAPSYGRVVAIPDAYPHPTHGWVIDVAKYVAVGDLVYYGKYAGVEVTLDGVTYLLLHLDDLFARVREAHG